MIDLFEKCAKPSLAAEAKRLGIYPYFHALESKQDVEVIMEGKRRIMLGSNNYLGLTTNSSVVEAGVQAYRTLPERDADAAPGTRSGAGQVPRQARHRHVLDRVPVQPRHHQRHCRHA